jgi:predicted Na+-dependent transporter
VVVNLALHVFMYKSSDLHLPFWDTFAHIFFITIIPATLGILIRRRFPLTAEKISKPSKYIMLSLLAVVFAIKLFAGEKHGGSGLTPEDFIIITPIALIQNASCLFFGYFAMKKWAFPIHRVSQQPWKAGYRIPRWHSLLPVPCSESGNGETGTGIFHVFLLDGLHICVCSQ